MAHKLTEVLRKSWPYITGEVTMSNRAQLSWDPQPEHIWKPNGDWTQPLRLGEASLVRGDTEWRWFTAAVTKTNVIQGQENTAEPEKQQNSELEPTINSEWKWRGEIEYFDVLLCERDKDKARRFYFMSHFVLSVVQLFSKRDTFSYCCHFWCIFSSTWLQSLCY